MPCSLLKIDTFCKNMSPPEHCLAFNKLYQKKDSSRRVYLRSQYPFGSVSDIGIMDRVNTLLLAGSQILIVNINFETLL